jgi:hypothetical protein
MQTLTKRSFDTPDEVRTPDKTRVEILTLGDVRAARFTMQPGWRWSTCVGPVVGTTSCQLGHIGVVAQGRMRLRHDDGTEIELGPGEAYVIEPGHDAWIIGEEAFMCHEFDQVAAATFAERGAAQ